MLKYSLRLLPFIFIIQTAQAQSGTLYNNGSVLHINSLAVVQVNGDMNNQAGSSYNNNGTVNVLGNFSNNQVMSSPYSGVLRFNGSSAQTVSGGSKLWANNVEINNPAGVSLSDTLYIDGEVSFISGIVTATDSTQPIWLSSIATISTTNPPTDASHVRGYVVREGTGSFSYPVGDGAKYQKIDLDLSANSAGMRVHYDSSDAGVAAFGTTGSDTTLLLFYNKPEHWDCTPIGTATGTVKVYWDNYRNGGTTVPADLRVAHKTGGSWLNEGTTGVGTASAGSVTSNSLSSWSPFALGSISLASPLPIELLSFGGKAFEGYNLINWTTGVEIANTTYELERSNDARQYTKVASLAAKGNSNNSYQYKDDYLWEGDVYYRLKIIELGSAANQHYSNTIKLVAKGKSARASVLYPNPANQYINLSAGSTSLLGTTLRISDVTGKVLQEILLETLVQKIDLSHYAAGDYIIGLDNGETFKLTKAE